jgi:hypothetical protein
MWYSLKKSSSKTKDQRKTCRKKRKGKQIQYKALKKIQKEEENQQRNAEK